MSGFTDMLAHMDERAQYDSINMDLVNTEGPDTPTLQNRTARNTRVGLFLCPSVGGVAHLND